MSDAGDVFALVEGALWRLAYPWTSGWGEARDRLPDFTVTALAAQAGGPALAGLAGGGVFAWTGEAWAQAQFGDMPVRQVAALYCTPDGAVLVCGKGDGAYVGDGRTWTPLTLGLSNVVSAFARTSAGVSVVSLQPQAVLSRPAPEAPIVLSYDDLGLLPDPDASLAASLDQGLVTQALVHALQGVGVSLSGAATVAAAAPGGWTLVDGDRVHLLGARRGAICVGAVPDPLILDSLSPVTLACQLTLADGTAAATTLLPGDVLWRPALASDVIVAELALVRRTEIAEGGSSTLMTLEAPLANVYDASTVSVCANVVAATQGMTVQQVLGSGDATAALQQFSLSQPPLTFVPAPPPANSRSTLVVKVDGAVWTETNSLQSARPTDRVYTVDLTPNGGAVITFGDGAHGARLPTGDGNVTATYRSGMGPVGDAGAAEITILLQPPPGIAKVTNPLPITPGRPPEAQAIVMQRAPGRLRAAGRLVTRDDFAGFIGACDGVAQAATWELDAGGRHVLQITIAVAEGAKPQASDALVADLKAQIAARSAIPPPPLDLQLAALATFDVSARLWLEPGAPEKATLAAAAAALRGIFSPAARRLAQPVYGAEVERVLQTTPGVAGVSLEALLRSGGPQGLADELKAQPGRWDPAALTIRPAELLVARAEGLILTAGDRSGT
jgi:hypothetical protein